MNFKNGILILFSIGLLFSCAGNKPQPAKAVLDWTTLPMPVDSLVHKGTLANGLTYYLRQNPKPAKRVELRLVVNAGSILENDLQQGLAHLCEHMAFNGSKHFHKQGLVNYLESIGMRFGADLNAYTSFDETVYKLQIPTDDEEILKKGFWVLQDWAQNVTYDDEEIDKERGVVIEEWRLGRGAQMRMLDKQLPIMFKGSKYAHRLPIGQKAVLDTFKHETLRSFYKTWYHPALMAVVVSGDLDLAKMEALVHENFDSLTNPQPLPERKTFGVPDHKETLFAIASDPEAQYSVVSMNNGYPAEDESTTKAYREGIVERLFTGMLNKRMQELGQSENPPFLYGYGYKGGFIRPFKNYSLTAVVKPGGIDRGLETLITEARRIEQFGFTDSELAREKMNALRSIKKSFLERDKQESGRYADEYIRNFLTKEPIPGIAFEYELYQHFLPGITLKEVNALAEKWVKPHNRVVVVSVPEKEGLPVPTESELKQVLSDAQHIAVSAYTDDALDQPLLAHTPKAGTVVKENHINDLDLTEWTLSNGVKVVLKPTDFKNDEIVMSSYSPGGISQAATKNLTPAQMAASIAAQSGFGPFNQMQLQKKLAGRVLRVNMGIGELTEAFYGSTTPQDLETMLQLLYLEFTAPREDSTAYKALMGQMSAFLQNKGASPESIYQDSVLVTFSGHHPRYKPLTMESLKEMDLRKSIAFYKDRFADAGDFTFFFAGNFDLKTIRPLIETYLGGLPSTGRKETWKDVTFDYPTQKVENIFHKGIEPKSQNTIIFSGDIPWSEDNIVLLNALTGVLNIKLRERLREDKSGTYGIGVRANLSHYPRQRYKISIGFGCDPQRVDELTTELFSQIDSLQQFGLDKSYLDKVKNISQREFEKNVKRNNFWLSKMKYVYFNQIDPENILKRNERVQKLTMKEIRDAANKYLNKDKFVRVVVLPEK